jgi:hypothetical protein
MRRTFLERLGRAITVDPELELSVLAQRAILRSDVTAVVVLREADVLAFLRSVLAVSCSLPLSVAEAWYQAFTRTLFLVGNPQNLAARYPLHHVTQQGSVAWLAPTRRSATVGVCRLLKPIPESRAPNLPRQVELLAPGKISGRRQTLLVATRGLSWASYLVHVNHTLAESVITRLIAPGDRIRLRHVDSLDHWPRGASHVRVHFKDADSTQLRLYTALIHETRPSELPYD